MAEQRVFGDWSVDEQELEFVGDPALHLESGGNANLRPCRFEGRDHLLKDFHGHHLADVNAAALANLVDWRWQLPEARRAELDGFAAWPRRRVFRDGRLCGVLMPLAAPPFYRRRRDGGRTPRTVYDLMALPAREGAPLEQKLRTFGRVVEAVLWLHEQGVVVNDLQPANILCDDLGQAVWLVDCDSMAADARWGIVAPVAAPESMKDVVPDADLPTVATDLAKLAWVLIRVLLDDNGITGLGTPQRARLEAALGERATGVLLGAAFNRNPVPTAWRQLADEWSQLTLRIPTTPREETTAADGPRVLAVPAQRRPPRERGGWLPADFSYRPGPAPQVFPPGHLEPWRHRGRLRTTALVLVGVAAIGGLLAMLAAVGADLLGWGS